METCMAIGPGRPSTGMAQVRPGPRRSRGGQRGRAVCRPAVALALRDGFTSAMAAPRLGGGLVSFGDAARRFDLAGSRAV